MNICIKYIWSSSKSWSGSRYGSEYRSWSRYVSWSRSRSYSWSWSGPGATKSRAWDRDVSTSNKKGNR